MMRAFTRGLPPAAALSLSQVDGDLPLHRRVYPLQLYFFENVFMKIIFHGIITALSLMNKALQEQAKLW